MTIPHAPRKSLEPWILDSVLYYPHQVDGIRDLARRNSFLLADEMGLGKSLQALTVFAIDVVLGHANTCIIICPVTLKGNWYDEIEKFSRFPAMVLNGTPKQRDLQIQEFVNLSGPKILIVNYEQVVAHQVTLNALSFDIAVFDEAHYLKNHKAKRTKACLTLRSKRSFLLTGTPMLNHVDELWTLLHRIDPHRWPNYWTFLNRYAVWGGYKDKQIVGVKNEKELTESLHGVMLRRLKKNVLDIPDVQIIERRVDLLPEQQKLYDEVINDMRLPQPDGATPEDIENALEKFLRLKQICGTTATIMGMDYDFSSKLDLAIFDTLELLENGHRDVIFTQFRPVQLAYINRIKKAGREAVWWLHGDVPQPDRQPIVKEWSNSSEPGVLVCMIQVAGVGLNMTASRNSGFLDELFVPGLNKQAIDRLHRIGADKVQPIQVRKYLCRNTIENRVQTILRTKSRLFGEIVETNPNWKRRLYEALMSEDDAA